MRLARLWVRAVSETDHRKQEAQTNAAVLASNISWNLWGFASTQVPILSIKDTPSNPVSAVSPIIAQPTLTYNPGAQERKRNG